MNTPIDLQGPARSLQPAGLAASLLLATGLWAALAAPAGAQASVPAAPTLQAATRALQGGATDQARQLLAELRKQAPEDAHVRFLQGVLQAQQGRTDEAIGIFRELTRSHPQLSEPHNNLGVLLASRGQLSEARAAFEQALLTHPSFAAAHRNLLDVQSQMARQSFARALMAETGKPAAHPTLTLLAALDTQDRPTRNPPRPAAPTSPTESASASAVAGAPAASSTASAPVLAAVPAAPAASTPMPAPRPAASATPPAPTTAATSSPAAPAPKPPLAENREARLRENLKAWAKAWSSQSMRDYLGAYDQDFQPPRGMSRAQWQADRQLKITSKRSIDVDISQLEIRIDGSTATTRFRQTYSSDNLKVSSRKTLQWVWRDGRWRITRETTG